MEKSFYTVLDATDGAYYILSEFQYFGEAVQYASEQIDGHRHIMVKNVYTGVVLMDSNQPNPMGE